MTVNTANFGSILKEMKASYLEGSAKEFSLASYTGLQAPSLKDASQDLKNVTKEHEASLLAFQTNEEAKIQAEVQTFEQAADSKALEEFKRKLKESQEKAKQAAADLIDMYYAKITKIAEDNPEQVTLILFVAEKVTELMKEILTKIAEVVAEVIESIVKAVMDVINFVSTAFKEIKKHTTSFFEAIF